MRMRNWRPLAALVVVCALCLPMGLGAGALNIKTYILFNGSNAADSTERASIWIPIRGAQRVYIRTWSAGATADTDFCDTITTWKTLLSDSVLFTAVDSLGTIVTARSGIPRTTTSGHGEPFPMCADSVMITNQLADSIKMVAVVNPVEGVQEPVRGSGTGSGRYTTIMPTPVQAAFGNIPTNSQIAGANEVFMAQYLRIRILPRTRLTSAGSASTQGIRTRGLNKLKMIAHVVYPNN